MLTFAPMLVLGLAFLIQSVDPSGHWVGLVTMPEMTLPIEIDIDKNTDGQLVATFGQPEQGVKGRPFSSVTIEDRTVRLVLKAGPQATTFEGTLSANGQEVSGTATQAGMSAPFSLTRKGAAQIPPAPRSGPISRQLEGTWNGRLDVDGTPQQLILRMANRPDGTSAGTVMSPDGSGVEIPLAIAQDGARVVVDVTSVGASFAGTLNTAGTELTGTWAQGGLTLPVTFTRADK